MSELECDSWNGSNGCYDEQDENPFVIENEEECIHNEKETTNGKD